MTLQVHTREDIVRYRIERAEEEFQNCTILAEAGRRNFAANRLYYALYYAASALLDKLKKLNTLYTHQNEKIDKNN